MTNPINKLPQEIKEKVREYASDKTQPTPTAAIIKNLRFRYEDETLNPICLPKRLEVDIDDSHKTRARFFLNMDWEVTMANFSDSLTRRYLLFDFLPS